MSVVAKQREPEDTPAGLHDLRAFLIDMDGVLYRGNTPLPGAKRFLEHLRARGIPHLFLTNNSSATPDQYTRKLARMGMQAEPQQILTSAQVAVEDLERQAKPGDRALLVGGTGLREALALSKLAIAESADDAAFVIVGLDRGITYEKLAQATLAVGKGASFLGTNGDLSYPTERGLEPGAGALLAAIEAATGVAPRIYGKPEPPMFEAALRMLGTPRRTTAMLGDRYETDIMGGARAGLLTVAVTTGVSREEDLRNADPPPNHIFASLTELLAALGE